MRRFAFVLVLLAALPLTAFAENWTRYGESGCIGGSECGGRGRKIRIHLEDRPVVGVRFSARDDIGTRSDGKLRVKIGDTIVRDDIDIKRNGSTIVVDVSAVRGNYLTIEPASDDEVKVSDIEVLYGSEVRRPRRSGVIDRSRGGWRRYENEARCIGGVECRKNGSRITLALEDAPVIGLRFRAHDNIGTKADGRLRVRIDDETIESYIDIPRNGKLFEFDIDGITGNKLVIECATDDEVDVRDIEVLYAREEHRDRDWNDRGGRELDERGGCIGGDECGGRRARIRIPLRDRPIRSIEFYAHDDVGVKAAGMLRVSVDDETLEDFIDIKREGRTHTIDGRGLRGRYLIIAPAADDEVVVKDIRVKYE